MMDGLLNGTWYAFHIPYFYNFLLVVQIKFLQSGAFQKTIKVLYRSEQSCSEIVNEIQYGWPPQCNSPYYISYDFL